MSNERQRKLASIKLHPFLIIMGALVVGSFGTGGWRASRDWSPLPPFQALGRGLVLIGILVLVFAYGAMARARTTINPRLHTTRIVTRGIYRLSRNPIYLGWFLMFLGVGLATSSPYRILLALVMIGLLRWAVVLPEEEYLEETFGEEYLQYKRRVRRWL